MTHENKLSNPLKIAEEKESGVLTGGSSPEESRDLLLNQGINLNKKKLLMEKREQEIETN